MQKIWIVTGESLGKEFYSLSVKKRKRIRIILLTAMMLVMSILENFVYLHSKPYYGITMLFISIIISVISFVSIETNLKKLNWRNSLTASWLALWIMAIISDFIVDKRYQYQGFIMLFIVGFFSLYGEI